ncbi:hypothetical protein MMAD_56890 (plasmid) [Mycolicibacterium madagascariense]|uniref:Helicase C-terminal domain-containing protein n=1 Tax=Mycolicibacterium madagascariense TaxID=212765 RepID=A0A7I7XQH5_9MYCO|nr:hypothetical protein MMAD_56890 [Mycolicibacterium madagascariense]
MDDDSLYGPTFHRLGFGEAVERGLLTDYKVLVLTVDEKYIAGPLQQQLADVNSELNLDDATKIVGCWNGLAKRTGKAAGGADFGADVRPMQRAVAFLRDIKSSKKLAGKFATVIDAYDQSDDQLLRCDVEHVDGTYNALERNHRLQWLKAPLPENQCRILANARCLSEGVDVPSLDAVLFLNPRSSVVDVVQSVGRVMRRAEGKQYGYIILPVGVPAGVAPSQALADNRRFKVVWQVLQALRAHDDRFNATVNKLELNRKAADSILVGHVPNAAEDLTATTNDEGTTSPSPPANPRRSLNSSRCSPPTNGATRSTPRSSTRSAPAHTGKIGPRMSRPSPSPSRPVSGAARRRHPDVAAAFDSSSRRCAPTSTARSTATRPSKCSPNT